MKSDTLQVEYLLFIIFLNQIVIFGENLDEEEDEDFSYK